MPTKNITDITGWSTDPQEYTKIVIREMSMDNSGRNLHTIFETENNHLIKEILDYLNSYELKRWYNKRVYSLKSHEKYYDIHLENEERVYRRISLVKEYVQLNNKNYLVRNKANIENDYFQGILQQMNIIEQ